MIALCVCMIVLGLIMIMIGHDEDNIAFMILGFLLLIAFAMLGFIPTSNQIDKASKSSNSSSCSSIVSKSGNSSNKILQITENNKVIMTYSIRSYKQDDKTVTIIKVNGAEETIILNNDSKVNIYDVK